MLEIKQEGMKMPKVEYDIYSKLNEENLTKLNIDTCQNNKISLLIPVKNISNLDKLNSKSGYYNNICYTATSDSGTDITLNDRKSEYPSIAVCQDDCEFADYNITLNKAKCSCQAKEFSSSFADMKINKNKLLDNFKNIKNIVNFKILKCFEVLFSRNGISKNIGFFLLIFIIIFHIISIFIFYLKQFDLLINKIKEIIFSIIILKSIKDDKEEENNNKEINEIINGKIKEKNNKEIEDNRNKIILNNNNNNNNIINNNPYNNIIKDGKTISFKKKGKIVTQRKKYKILKKDLGTFINNNNVINKDLFHGIIIINNNRENNGRNILFKKNSKTDETQNRMPVMDYIDDELNDLSYDLALQNDKRTLCQYYISLIKTKHELVFAFFYSKDYNSRVIKIDLFLFGFALNYTVNGFFFNDSTMHNVYESKGLFDVSYQLPIIFYSSLISMFLGALVQMLGLSNDVIIDFKKNREPKDVNERGKKLVNKLKIKFVLYFIFILILLLFFLYYISMFDAVYKNTQYILIEDTLMGYGFSLLYPFVIYLLPGLFRIPALNAPMKNKKYLYNFSKLFTIL